MLGFTKVQFLVVGVLAITGCSSKDDKIDADRDVKRGVGNLIEDAAMLGYWATPCDSYPLLQSSARAQMNFDSSVYMKTVRLFEDPACVTPAVDIRFHGEVTLGKSDTVAPDLKLIDTKITKIEVEPLSAGGVGKMNFLHFCGITTWEAGKVVDLTALVEEKKCLPERAGTTEYDVYKLDGNTLRFGSTYLLGATTDPAGRLHKLSDQRFESSESWN